MVCGAKLGHEKVQFYLKIGEKSSILMLSQFKAAPAPPKYIGLI